MINIRKETYFSSKPPFNKKSDMSNPQRYHLNIYLSNIEEDIVVFKSMSGS